MTLEAAGMYSIPSDKMAMPADGSSRAAEEPVSL